MLTIIVRFWMLIYIVGKTGSQACGTAGDKSSAYRIYSQRCLSRRFFDFSVNASQSGLPIAPCLITHKLGY